MGEEVVVSCPLNLICPSNFKGRFFLRGVKVVSSRIQKQDNQSIEMDREKKLLRQVDVWYWLVHEKIKLASGDYELEGHQYQVDWFHCNFPKQVFKKAAQMAVTTSVVLKRLHGLIYGKYKQGVLYLFPTRDDVTDFSKDRFQPILANNPHQIGRFVGDTDAANIKRIGNSTLYLRGARASQKIEGIKETSSALKSIPVDSIVFDEKDEMSPFMIQLALERFSHSELQEEVSLSTPSIPDYGIDKNYDNSDKRVWMIKCGKCNELTCLELEFPECLLETINGKVIRICRKCKNEIYPRDGQWVAQSPSKSNDLVGWWISQLNSKYVNPRTILELFKNPPDGNIAEIYNSKLGMAYISVEDQLKKSDIFACCGNEVFSLGSHNTCAMGVDVGAKLHVVVGHPRGDGRYRIVYLNRVDSFEDVHDVAKRFNVKCAVVDMEPETRKARDFRKSEPYGVYLCDYQERLKTSRRTDEKDGLVTVRRTETMDAVHNLIISGKVEFPRRNAEIEQYALEMTNTAKILQEDELTGSRRYVYKKLGDDHYYHATNYFIIACGDVRVVADSQKGYMEDYLADEKAGSYDPFLYLST
ncbi:MAG: phage terminase large subunit family protein [Methanolobus sp.]|uniref:phage terminase large subunit family protein n=1 Tax=Methanolobus sp. TaxID=1874737 RepID=UPI00272FFF6C|nr:phage terminase large subunit family protein [Methanolobus sp.]MDP2218554.1 phage terminase large subunit family protein [Methanolobus sp.]